MNRLKKMSNHTDQLNNDITEKNVQNGGHPRNPTGNFFADSFQLAKQLIAELPIVPTNDRVYELVQDVERGDYEDISSIEEAYKNWDAWIDRTREILKARNILLSSSRLRKLQK